jgi:hypothetical protein
MYQTVIGITINPSERSNIGYTLTPSHICQELIELFSLLSFTTGTGVFMNVAIREHCIFETKFLDMAEFTTLTPQPLLISS